MMYCKKCGAKLDSTQKFCVKCGTPYVNNSHRSAPPRKKRKGKAVAIIIICAVIALLIAAAVVIIRIHGKNESSDVQITENSAYTVDDIIDEMEALLESEEEIE